jgi:ADP-ribosylglycohydrolase
MRLDKFTVSHYFYRWLSREEYSQVFLNNTDKFCFDKTGDNLKDLGGYILDAIAIAQWGLLNFDNFKDGMVAVIQLGGDTDTNAAIYGQLAGAYYGYKAIPKHWTKDLYLHDEIVELADKLLAMKNCPIIRTRFEEDGATDEHLPRH